MRLTLDTNVVASGLLWHGTPAQLIDAAQAGEVELFTSRALLAELVRILQRAKFNTAITVSGLALDDLVLACALAARAALIVSGDAHLLNLKTYHRIRIVSATEALALIAKP